MLTIISGLFLFTFLSLNAQAAEQSQNKSISSQQSRVVFTEKTPDQRYAKLMWYHNNKLLHVFHGTEGIAWHFDAEPPTQLSKNGQWLLLSNLELASLVTPKGVQTVSTAYCRILAMQSGCLVAKETGGFCAGHFVDGHFWQNASQREDLTQRAPSAKAYLSGQLLAGDDYYSSLDNLMACDPISSANRRDYRKIIEKNLFHLSPTEKAQWRTRLQ